MSLQRRLKIPEDHAGNEAAILKREWLLTNGMGGYASGTVSGRVSRRYHGLLVAALPAPWGRVVMLNHLAEYVHTSNFGRALVGGPQPAGPWEVSGEPHHVEAFRLEDGMPVWLFKVAGLSVEKRVYLAQGQNTAFVSFELLTPQDGVVLELSPGINYRPHESDVNQGLGSSYTMTVRDDRYEILTEGFPALRLHLPQQKASFTYRPDRLAQIGYQTEAERGYASTGPLWTPGSFEVPLRPRHVVTLVASTEEWDQIEALTPSDALGAFIERRRKLVAAAPAAAHEAPAAELVIAADQFIITPQGRTKDAARARAEGEDIRTVIAGYHWFTDWGRDTMISLEGLTLSTGRHTEAGWILRTFGHYVRNGLIPNLFPEGEAEGLYHTADASLWFFHAVDRYISVTGDRSLLNSLLPVLVDIAEHHIKGTHFGIHVDPEDGLLVQGAEGYQLTWMDAKVDGWVVTPRRGKAVEINALWYNALSLLAIWKGEGEGEQAGRYSAMAEKHQASFNRRFWRPDLGHLLDVVDGEGGDDTACRPNQIFAVSLPHAVLEPQHWEKVVQCAKDKLLTPVGLRSLSPNHPDYKATYFGDLTTRDAAYHQGTVWGWLIGPFIDGWLKVHPEDQQGARQWLSGVMAHLDDACIGSISEVFDAEAPFTPRGCIAQAWSVAEALRCWVKTAG